MSIAGFKSRNHPQQTGKNGALDHVDDRGTAPEVFGPLNDRFRFTLDVAASAENTKCERFFTHADDGLRRSWAGERVWCNPPYSDCRSWVQKAWDEWNGLNYTLDEDPVTPELIVMLLPANRVEQSWWQDLVEPFRDRPGSELRVEFLRGRMRFIRPNAVIDPRGDRPPFGCCLLIWSNA